MTVNVDNCVYKPHAWRRPVATAFTLIEVVVAISVTSVLASLLIGQVAAVRKNARQLDCLQRMSQTGKLLFAYSLDQRDRLPYGGDRARDITLPDGSITKVGGWRGLRMGRWQALFPEVWTGTAWPRSLGCPLRPPFNPSNPGTDPYTQLLPYESNPLGPYWMSEAIWIDPRTRLEPDEGVAPQQNHLADVVFPSAKVYLFEAPAFCVAEPGSEWWVRTYGQTHLYRSSTLMMDGAVRRTRPTATYLRQAGAFYFTPFTVRGRDELES